MKKIKQLFVVLVSLGLLASLCLNWSRHQVEQANRSMETVMNYQALVRMADSEGLSRQSVFKKFKDAGVTTLAVSDRTIMDMAGEGLVTYYTGGELLRQKEIGGLSPSWQAIVSSPDFTYQAVYLADGTSRRTFDALIETLGARFDRDRFQKVSDTPRVYMLKAPTALNKNPFSQDQLGIQETPLILVPDELLAAKENGFMVAIRPNNFVKTTKDEEKAQQQLAVFFKEIDETGADVSLIIGTAAACSASLAISKMWRTRSKSGISPWVWSKPMYSSSSSRWTDLYPFRKSWTMMLPASIPLPKTSSAR